MDWKKMNGALSLSDPKIEERNSEAFAFARGWQLNKNVWICGKIGTGKTFLAQALGKYAKDSERYMATIAFASANQMLRWPSKDHPNSLFREGLVCRVTILDDLDKMDARYLGRLYELMEVRHSKAWPTIITANSTPRALCDHLMKAYTENPGQVQAAFDRMNPLHKIELRGKSLRPDIDA